MAFTWEWLRGKLDYQEESETFAALTIAFAGNVLTRHYDINAGGQRDAVQVPLYPLALGIARNWWTLLHEPRKFDNNNQAEGRHSLDISMSGFLFPPLSLWSSGEDTVLVEMPLIEQKYYGVEFLRFNPPSLSEEAREEIQNDLFELITSVLRRISRESTDGELKERWSKILVSLDNNDEREYCIAAGRLGIDPYDPDGLDISGFAEGLSRGVFADVCDATTPEELPDAVKWARDGEHKLGNFPALMVGQFGNLPPKEAKVRPYAHGYLAARAVRQNLGLEGLSPRRVIDRIFGAAVRHDAPTLATAPHSALEGISGRANGAIRVAIPGVPSRLRRSNLCRAAYLAWGADDGASSAVTTAITFKQQASRAFAAELLAPADRLRDQAGSSGLTPSDVERIAGENICPEPTVIWQAHNNGIPLRGVGLPGVG